MIKETTFFARNGRGVFLPPQVEFFSGIGYTNRQAGNLEKQFDMKKKATIRIMNGILSDDRFLEKSIIYGDASFIQRMIRTNRIL